jgi:uncharacterized membrane protein
MFLAEAMGHGTMYGWGMGWFGGIFMIVFWVLVLVGLVFVIKWLLQSTSGKSEAHDFFLKVNSIWSGAIFTIRRFSL